MIKEIMIDEQENYNQVTEKLLTERMIKNGNKREFDHHTREKLIKRAFSGWKKNDGSSINNK